MKIRIDRRGGQFVLLALILGPILMACDIAIAQLCYAYPVPPGVLRILQINGFFASNGFGVLAVIVGFCLLRRINLSQLPQLLSASLGGGLLADIVKLCICRSRPNSIALSSATFSSTFHGFFPLLSAGNHGQSFPSGHAAVAAGFATALSIRFPRLRWLFVTLGVAAAASRVVLHVHFATDVVVGGTLGTGWALVCHSDWFESMIERLQIKIERLRLGAAESSKPIVTNGS
jgi:membrane-associated phospholipid phosphatase